MRLGALWLNKRVREASIQIKKQKMCWAQANLLCLVLQYWKLYSSDAFKTRKSLSSDTKTIIDNVVGCFKQKNWGELEI